jgi:hypothetical protein
MQWTPRRTTPSASAEPGMVLSQFTTSLPPSRIQAMMIAPAQVRAMVETILHSQIAKAKASIATPPSQWKTSRSLNLLRLLALLLPLRTLMPLTVWRIRSMSPMVISGISFTKRSHLRTSLSRASVLHLLSAQPLSLHVRPKPSTLLFRHPPSHPHLRIPLLISFLCSLSMSYLHLHSPLWSLRSHPAALPIEVSRLPITLKLAMSKLQGHPTLLLLDLHVVAKAGRNLGALNYIDSRPSSIL